MSYSLSRGGHSHRNFVFSTPGCTSFYLLHHSSSLRSPPFPLSSSRAIVSLRRHCSRQCVVDSAAERTPSKPWQTVPVVEEEYEKAERRRVRSIQEAREVGSFRQSKVLRRRPSQPILASLNGGLLDRTSELMWRTNSAERGALRDWTISLASTIRTQGMSAIIWTVAEDSLTRIAALIEAQIVPGDFVGFRLDVLSGFFGRADSCTTFKTSQ